MDYSKAIELKQKNRHLVGKKYNGSVIGELILAPTNPEKSKEFLNNYILTLDGDESIKPFRFEDVEIFAVFSKKSIQAVFFAQTNIRNLPNELGAIL